MTDPVSPAAEEVARPTEVLKRARAYIETTAHALRMPRPNALLAEIDAALRSQQAAHEEEIAGLRGALTALRGLVKEGGVPRYTVTPGAALNCVIEDIVDPVLRRAALTSTKDGASS